MDVARTGRSSLGNAKGRLCEPITLQICWMGAPGSGRVEVPGGAVLGMPGAVSVYALESLAWRLRGFSMDSVSLRAAAAGEGEMRPRLRGHGKECRKRVQEKSGKLWECWAGSVDEHRSPLAARPRVRCMDSVAALGSVPAAVSPRSEGVPAARPVCP